MCGNGPWAGVSLMKTGAACPCPYGLTSPV